MAKADGTPSTIACIGMLGGMLLLGLAGTLVILTPSSPMVDARRLQTVLGYVSATTPRPSSFDSWDSSSSSDMSLEPSKSSESGSLKSSGPGLEALGSTLSTTFTSTGGQLLLMMIFAFLYNKKVVDVVVQKRGTLLQRMESQEAPDSDDFENGICECMDDKWVCIHGLCCPLVRVAHTNAVAGVCGFWETALCWCCCALWSVNLGPCCLLVYWRMKVKEVMQIEDHVLNDFCITLFCPWLSICQQGTAVDTAMGYEVTGCMNLEFDHDHGQSAGQPLNR